MGTFAVILLWTMSAAIIRSTAGDKAVQIFSIVYWSIFGLYRFGLSKGNEFCLKINRIVKVFDDLIPAERRRPILLATFLAGLAVAFF